MPPFILAMPSDGLRGDGSGYIRQPSADFERWIVDDVPAAVRQAVPGLAPEAPCFITGLSMGGFGALSLGARHGDRFRAATGHSSITEFGQLAWFMEENLADLACPAADTSVLQALRDHRDRLPAIRFDCGTEDVLLKANRSLHEALLGLGIAHEYAEHPGGHTWPYWETHLADSLRFFAAHAGGR